MKISKLFESLEEQLAANLEYSTVFSSSGMTNTLYKLKRGFFPLGTGILTELSEKNIAEIPKGGAMVLGNDFGTESYLKNKCSEGYENNSATIRNLKNIKLPIVQTFFTNFYLGLRDDIEYNGQFKHGDGRKRMTMTHMPVPRTREYKEFCMKFFQKQLKMVDPKLVICMGKEVGLALPGLFDGLLKKGRSLSSLYIDDKEKEFYVETNDEIYGQRIFIIIPHPSYAHINWRNHEIKNKIEAVVSKNFPPN